ncbi:hypothetical protein [endosymbiont GvMRE of Glomus versiforme]|uniref:hypothetical protein n=1 Tax=endosymbiont GvMRE of Glomus versiforme TaxID=2039283 RepID=UPI000EECCC04|nr:hypothetical protein [endosymbiont GvMRE of Glomus versiforme]RHZ36343.1 hypothetical protein GvMRE_Ic1g58 [endosymbiont GvMRE of Glomus versiforme]
MTKQQLAEELKRKVKLGVKPSDLKKQKKNSQFNQQLATPPDSPVLGPVQTNQLLTPPPTLPLKPIKTNNSPSPIVQYPTPPDSPLLKPTKPSKPANNLKDLQQQVNYWSKTAQSHLLNLSKTSAELFNAEERIKELETKPKSQTLSQEAEKALIEANQRIRELEKQNQLLKKAKPLNQPETKTFTCSDCQQEWNQEFIRLIDKQGNKYCPDCMEEMLKETIQATGKELTIETQKETKTEPTKPCQFCHQLKPETSLKPRHIKNLPNHDPREISLICQDCLTYRAIKADYYCPLTSEGRDTY